MASRVSIGHRLEYFAFRGGLLLLRALPERWALALGGAVGWLAGVALRIRRDVTDANLERAFPERDRRWRNRIAAASYRNLGREAVATFRYAGEPLERVRARIPEPVGHEALMAAVSVGHGAVLVTGHLGNWELGGASLAARGVRLDAVAVRQANRLFDDALVRARGRLGISVIRRGDAPRAVLQSLRAGHVVALVADQDARSAGIFVDFLGSRASTPRGPALFALRAGVPLFLGICLPDQTEPGRYRCRIEEVRVERTGNLEADVHRLTAAHAAALAACVRDHPEHYFWPHRRWRTRPPDASVEAAGPDALPLSQEPRQEPESAP